jgi:hypothetical protein
MSKVSSLVAQASTLDDKELEDLFARLRGMVSVFQASSTKPVVADKATEVYRALAEAAFQARRIRLMPVAVFRMKRGWPKFAQAVEEFEIFVDSLEKDRIKKIAVRRWLSNLMVNYLSEREIRVSTQSLTWVMLNISAVVDLYFPGYMASGLMHLVLKPLYKGTKRKLKLPE